MGSALMLAEPISTDNGNTCTSLAGLAIPSGAMNLLFFSIPLGSIFSMMLDGQGPTNDFCHKYVHRKLVTVTHCTYKDLHKQKDFSINTEKTCYPS